jgi:large subunit ribosomal protein L33
MIKYLCSKKRRHITMAKKDDRSYVTIKCSECKKFTYTTPKNKKNTTEKLEIKKACPVCGKHTIFKEAK